MNNPRDPRNIERIIQQAHGNARAPIKLPGNNPSQDAVLRERERMSRAQGRVLAPAAPTGLAPDISRIVWPDERDADGKPLALGNRRADMAQYGFDHGKQTAELAVVIAKSLGVAGTDLKVVEGAGRFHDLGRSRPWQFKEDHKALSAHRAAELMHNDPGLWANGEVRDGICALILRHDLSGPPPTDPRLVALWDADCFESVRLSPGTRDGVVVMNERMALCVTKWAQTEENQRRWRQHRGGW